MCLQYTVSLYTFWVLIAVSKKVLSPPIVSESSTIFVIFACGYKSQINGSDHTMSWQGFDVKIYLGCGKNQGCILLSLGSILKAIRLIWV